MADTKAPKGGAKASAKGGEKVAKAPAKSEGRSKVDVGVTASAAELVVPKGYVPRLKQHCIEVVRAKMKEEFKYENKLEVLTIDKIVLNMGLGEAVNDTKKVTSAA